MNTLIADRTPTKKIDICFCFEGDFPALYVTRLTATTRYLVRKRGSANRQTAYPRSQQKKNKNESLLLSDRDTRPRHGSFALIRIREIT